MSQRVVLLQLDTAWLLRDSPHAKKADQFPKAHQFLETEDISGVRPGKSAASTSDKVCSLSHQSRNSTNVRLRIGSNPLYCVDRMSTD
jgi:hypothetical protein